MIKKNKANLWVGFVIYNCLNRFKIVIIESNVSDWDMEKLNCKYCENHCVKNGFHSNGKQRFKCKSCGSRQLCYYKSNAYRVDLNVDIISLTKEGLGIRSLSRYLKVSTTTIIRRIIEIARTIKKPMVSLAKKYEVDELCT